MAVHIFNLRNRLQLVVARAGAQDVEQWGAFPVVEYQQHMIGLRSPPKQVGLPGAWGFIGHYFLYLLVSSCTLYFAMGKTEKVAWVIAQHHFCLKIQKLLLLESAILIGQIRRPCRLVISVISMFIG